jgi:hypothetical protein
MNERRDNGGPVLIHAVMAAGAVATGVSPVPGATLDLIGDDGLTALVSRLPRGMGDELFADAEASAAITLGHHELLTDLSAKIDLAPVRLGAACADDASVRALLAAEGGSFRAALARIAGAGEYAVTLTPIAGGASAAAPQPASGRAFLQRRSAEADARRRQGEAARAAAEAAFRSLLVHARAHAFQPPRRHALADQEKRLLDASLLVPASDAAPFADAVLAAQDKAAAAGCHLMVRGPFPAYSFVSPPAAEAA